MSQLSLIRAGMANYELPATQDWKFARNKTLVSSKGITPSFSRASTGTYFNSSGVLSSAAINEARFDHVYNSTTGIWESRGLLVEEQRTNLCPYSNDGTNATWTKSGVTCATNAATSPEGTSTAFSLIETAANVVHNLIRFDGAIAAGAATWSIYAKNNGRNYLVVRVNDFATDSNAASVVVDLRDGSIFGAATAYGTYSGASARVTAVGNGWYRISLTVTTVATGVGMKIMLSNDGSRGATGLAQAYLGDGVSGAYLFGAQYEAGAFPTSYIPTTASATRSADVCQVTGGSFSGFWNATEGSFAAEWDTAGNASGLTSEIVVASSDSNNFAGIRSGDISSVQSSFADCYVGGAQQARLVAGRSANGTSIRSSFRFKLNDFAYSQNGAGVLTDTAGTLPSPTILNIGSFTGAYLNGHISRLRYFNKALTDKQLEDLGKPELSKALDLQFASTKSLTPLVGPTPSYSRASAGWYFNSSGVLTQAAINEPRFDHTFDGSNWVSRGLLIEEQRQNLATYCNDFSDAAWTKTAATVVTNQATAPDGTQEADLVYPSSTGSDRYVFKNNTGGSAGQSRTNSCFFKAAGKSWVAMINSDGATAAWFNLATGSVGTVIGGSTSSITNVGNGWYRCTVTRATTSSSNSYNGFFICDGDNSTAVTASGTSGVYAWGMQLEAGASASSFIPAPAASQVVRSADVCTITGTNFSGMWNASEGSFIVGGRTTALSSRPLCSADDNTANESLILLTSSTDPKFDVVDGGVSQASIDAGLIASNTEFKLSAGWRANDFNASVSGGAVVSDASGTIPVVNQIRIGSNQAGSYTNGHIASLQAYIIRLPNRLLVTKST